MESVQRKKDSGAKSRNRRFTLQNKPNKQYKAPISISIDKTLLNELDSYCDAQNRKRSNVIEGYISECWAREKAKVLPV